MAAQEGVAVDAVEQHRRRPLGGLVEDGQGQGVPQQTARGLALAGFPEVLGEGDPVRRFPEADGEAEPQRLEADAPGNAQGEQARQQVQRRGEGWAVEGSEAAVVHVVDVQVVLLQQQVLGSGPSHEVEGVGIGADHDVGSVVHVLARNRVAIGGGASPEHAPPLEQGDLVPALLERDGGGQAGEAGTYHDDLHTLQ